MDFPRHNARSAGRWRGTLGQRSHRKKFVSGLTLEEKIKVTARIDVSGLYVGNTGVHRSCFFPDCVQRDTNDPHLNWNGLCLQDSPLGVHLAQYVGAFPSGINATATWDVGLIEARGKAMGAEFRRKGVNVALGPMMNMGRQATAGRNWEGFGAGPFFCCVVTATC
ncbi:Beta-glucosidase [Mycena venus]|uniref:beta-glucosidase n=1 Tax=Mycena venus TaxID=2733690 RepID=A0A8H7D5P3_9AGAR|nr:Beta-glucosidase [Mycena venus]